MWGCRVHCRWLLALLLLNLRNHWRELDSKVFIRCTLLINNSLSNPVPPALNLLQVPRNHAASRIFTMTGEAHKSTTQRLHKGKRTQRVARSSPCSSTLLWNSSASFELCKHKKHAAEDSYAKYAGYDCARSRNRHKQWPAGPRLYSNDRIDYSSVHVKWTEWESYRWWVRVDKYILVCVYTRI